MAGNLYISAFGKNVYLQNMYTACEGKNLYILQLRFYLVSKMFVTSISHFTVRKHKLSIIAYQKKNIVYTFHSY